VSNIYRVLNKNFILLVPLLLIILLTASCERTAKPLSLESRVAEFSSGFPPGVAEAFEFVLSMRIGWNLGNTLDAHFNLDPHETAWGNPRATQELINGVAAQGFGAVRIPVTWGYTIIDEEDFLIERFWMNRVEEVVGYVLNAGMKAIINIHHDGADSYYWLSVKNEDLAEPNKSAIDEKFTAVWRQIAERFKDTGENLIFEGFNELHDGSWGNGNAAQHARVNELNQIFVDTVRAVGGANSNRYLLIHGWVTRPSITVMSLVMPVDTVENRLIVGIHYYDPYDFAGSGRQNVWGNKSFPGNWANETHVINTFNMVKERFINNGIPIILGEYGAVNQSGNAFAYRKYYMEFVTKHAIDCGFVPFYWDNGGFGYGSEKFGLLRRTDGTPFDSYAEEILAVMMRAANEDYLLSSISAP
jgi:endoglucanase